MSTQVKPNTALIILAFFAIYIIWGTTYLFVAILLEELPPFMLAGIRFILASLLITAILPFVKHKERPSKSQFKNAIIGGTFFLILGNGMMSWALQYIDSGFASLIISAQPMIILLMLWVLYGQKIKAQSYLGVALGIIGIYLLVAQDQLVYSDDQWWGLLAVVSCLFTWGYGSLFVAKADMPKTFLVNTGIQMMFAGCAMVLISLVIEDVDGIRWTQLSSKTIFSMLYLIIFGSVVAFTAFNYLLKYVSPEKVSTSTYINPIVALFLGWYVLDEVVTLQSIFAAAILLLGVYFINSSRFEKSRKV